MTNQPHECDGRVFIEKTQPGDRVWAFQCPDCKKLYQPLPVFDTNSGQVHWFAGRPSAAMKAAASSGNVIHNVVAIAEKDPPLYDKIFS